jgi:hypothetical protein
MTAFKAHQIPDLLTRSGYSQPGFVADLLKMQRLSEGAVG